MRTGKRHIKPNLRMKRMEVRNRFFQSKKLKLTPIYEFRQTQSRIIPCWLNCLPLLPFFVSPAALTTILNFHPIFLPLFAPGKRQSTGFAGFDRQILFLHDFFCLLIRTSVASICSPSDRDKSDSLVSQISLLFSRVSSSLTMRSG